MAHTPQHSSAAPNCSRHGCSGLGETAAWAPSQRELYVSLCATDRSESPEHHWAPAASSGVRRPCPEGCWSPSLQRAGRDEHLPDEAPDPRYINPPCTLRCSAGGLPAGPAAHSHAAEGSQPAGSSSPVDAALSCTLFPRDRGCGSAPDPVALCCHCSPSRVVLTSQLPAPTA